VTGSSLIDQALEQSRRPLDASFEALLAELDAGTTEIRGAAFEIETDPPQFVLEHATRGGPPLRLVVAWSERVERELLRRKVVMDSPEDEAARGGALIVAALRILDLAYGEELVAAALWGAVEDRFGTIPSIRTVLARSHYPPTPRSSALHECRAKLREMFDGYGNALVTELGYSNRDAYPVLVAAVYYVMDRRFLAR
jgi:hypothetical protein